MGVKMALPLTSCFIILLATIFGHKKRDDHMMKRSRQFGSSYTVMAQRFGRSAQWAVYNCASKHVITSGLSRNRATTFCGVLSLASHPSPTLQKDNIRGEAS